MLHTLITRLAISLLVVGAVAVGASQPALAGTSAQCPAGQSQYITVPVDQTGNHCVATNPNTANIQANPIYYYLTHILRFLSAGVGIAVVGGIIWGGILYVTARANAAQTERARNVILNALIGLLLFIFMFAILSFLIPGLFL